MRLPSSKKIHAPSHPRNNKNKTKEEKAFWNALEEDAYQQLSGFQTGQFIRLSNRRPHFLHLTDSNGVEHLFHYGHLLHGSYGSKSEEDSSNSTSPVISLMFAAHTVTIEGSGLKILFNRIKRMTPEKLAVSNPELKSEITHIVVELRGE